MKQSENQHIFIEHLLCVRHAYQNVLKVIRKDRVIYQAGNYTIYGTKAEHIDRNKINMD